MLPLSCPKYLPCFRESPNGESPGCSWESLSFSTCVTWWLSCRVLRGLLSLLDATVGLLSHSVASVALRDHWGKQDAFLSASDSQYSHSVVGRLRVGSVTSQEALSYSTLGYILRSWKLLTLRKSWLQYKRGTPQKWPLSGTLGFPKRRKRTQNFLTFCCLPISCSPLFLSIKFPRQPLLDLSYPHDL